jgi:hypothetical protein
MGKCKIYSEINIINGVIEHEYANIARLSHEMCGTDAAYFEKKNDTDMNFHSYPL